VIRNLERLAEELEYHGVMAGKLLIIFDYKNGPTLSDTVSTGPPTRRFSLLLEAVRHAWKRVYIPGLLLYRMHLIADQLRYGDKVQRGLFDPPLELDRATTRLKLEVNAKHGRFALRSAATLPLREIYLDEAHGFEVCDIHGKTCF
jgi:DNA polymerase V